MTEWGVIGVIGTLIALVVSIGTPMLKLNSTITSLIKVTESLTKSLDEQKSDNTAAHKRIWDHCEKQDSSIADHETRITILEHKEEH